MPRPALSVVVPCYNEEGVLPEFLRRMGLVLDGVQATAEIVLVDDGSRDGTWKLLTDAAAADRRVVAVRLMRNHGHQLAITAGLSICRGERILIIDADLQDPPELLPDMMALMDGKDGAAGADVVYGQRRQREGEGLLKRVTAAAFYRLMGRLSDVAIPIDAGDFRLLTRRVLDALLAMPERHRFLRGMVAWIGGRQVPLLYDRKPRAAGEPKYSPGGMIRFSVDAITAFSVVPLTASLTLGGIMAALGFGFFVYSIVGWLLGLNLPGWTSLMAAIGLLGGMQFLMLGVIGAYLGRLYDQSKGRPLFMIRDIVASGGTSGGDGGR